MALIKCLECGDQVSTKANICPKCGAPVEKGGGCLKFIVLAFFVLFLIFIAKLPGDKLEPPTPTLAMSKSSKFEFSEAGIKSLSPTFGEVKLIPQDFQKGSKTKTTYLVSIEISRDPFTGGAQDWNMIANDVRELSTVLLDRPETKTIIIFYTSPQNGNSEWARVFIDQAAVPNDWRTMTYLELFSRTRQMAAGDESHLWLCDFFRKYTSARPGGVLPRNCNG